MIYTNTTQLTNDSLSTALQQDPPPHPTIAKLMDDMTTQQISE